MELGLKGKVAAVAAASSGLGFSCALELAREGARVAICSRDGARARRAAETIVSRVREETGAPGDVIAVAADLSAPDGAGKFLERARELGPIDILVSNSGGPPPGSALSVGEEGWRTGFDLTFLSAQRLAAGVAPAMRDRRWGRIIFITSISVKQPIGDLAISTAIRSGVAAFSKLLSDELAPHGVTVNCVAPGSIETARFVSLLERRAAERGLAKDAARAELESRIPARRAGRPEELAAAVAFLASERASYITGTVLVVDGGAVRTMM